MYIEESFDTIFNMVYGGAFFSTSLKPCILYVQEVQIYISRNLKYKIGQDVLDSISKLMSPFNYVNFNIDVLEELDDLDLLHEVQPERN